jgi:hypothetical protein
VSTTVTGFPNGSAVWEAQFWYNITKTITPVSLFFSFVYNLTVERWIFFFRVRDFSSHPN